jgi:surface carbohydrate biosynthesis protein (TIGR04326 family)
MNHNSLINNLDSNSTLLIWDSEDLPNFETGSIVLWNSFRDDISPNFTSIAKLVEQNAEDLKVRYLAWLYSLGKIEFQNKTLIDQLELRPGFSYWWMTQSVMKCNYSNSAKIATAFKLMALEDWLQSKVFTNFKFVSADSSLADCIEAWCKKKGLAFDWQRLPKISKKNIQSSLIRIIYQFFPSNIKMVVWLIRYMVLRWPLKGVGLREWGQSKGILMFSSYLLNIFPDSLKNGKFASHYWAHLPNNLQDAGHNSNWLHIYVKDQALPNASKAASLIKQFNVLGKGVQVHVTLDTFLSWRVLYKVILDWRLVRRVKIKRQDKFFTQSNSYFNLWSLFVDDWQRSIQGVEAISNLLNLNLYEAALRALPVQSIGVYLKENQDWEFAFIHAWKTFGHGDLIGAPNAFVRFWDLRYYFDPRSYDRKIKNFLPIPDIVAVNGKVAKCAYLGGSYPENKIIEVEALRYLYLFENSNKSFEVQHKIQKPLRVLAMGDYILHNTQLQLQMLEQAASLLPKDTIFVIKPHPNCPVNPAEYPELSMEVSMDPLSKLLLNCDVAYSSSLTGAAVDAYYAGVPVISILDPSVLNMSPLRDCIGAVFVKTPKELAQALIVRKVFVSDHKTFFNLDSNLPNWRNLLMESR